MIRRTKEEVSKAIAMIRDGKGLKGRAATEQVAALKDKRLVSWVYGDFAASKPKEDIFFAVRDAVLWLHKQMESEDFLPGWGDYNPPGIKECVVLSTEQFEMIMERLNTMETLIKELLNNKKNEY